jgi:hypothetical protein
MKKILLSLRIKEKMKMKRISFFSALILIGVLLFTSCKSSDSQKKSSSETKETANEKQEAETPDFRNLPQYVYCKIDGQPFLATYVFNAMNLPTRNDFATTEEQVKINGETKLSGMDFSFYTLAKVGAGTLTSTKDFYVLGHTDFPENGKLKSVSFKTKDGQHLTLTSLKDGLLEGTFNFDVADENDPSHILKITDGVFKMQLEGKTNLQFDKNGDIKMDSLLKNANQ